MRNRVRPQPMADVARELQDAAAARVPQQEKEGFLADGRLMDKTGRVYTRLADDISGARALDVTAAGAVVVWDSCGCGGGCSLDWYSDEQVAAMVASGPPMVPHPKRVRGSVSEWRAQDGSALLLAEVSIRWGDLMS